MAFPSQPFPLIAENWTFVLENTAIPFFSFSTAAGIELNASSIYAGETIVQVRGVEASPCVCPPATGGAAGQAGPVY